MWTRFFDMNSGGDQKLAWSHIYIEAPEDKAKGIFERLFNRDPENVTRQCCGPDYSISEEIDLQQGTAYERGCEFVHFDLAGMEISEADYMRMRYEDHKEVTARYVERGSRLFSSKQYQPLEEYMKSENARFINASEIDSISR
ncbi:MAG: hypothetical protein E6R03_00260 [Hyphomicrobiaceae bacterium]|nr:MAG: hypothetical protein E6R03_00260 [Hyphomicrobiaceae bacterium]